MIARGLVASWAMLACVVHAQDVVHGSADAFSAPGAALAWSISRGASEATTAVVVRVATDASRYPWIAVRGVDPFTKAEQPIAPPAPVGGTRDVRIPRSQFADTPRTEWLFFASEEAARAGAAALVVYYLGVPDTAPEFGDPAKQEAYLADRIAKARSSPGTRP